MSTTKEKDPVQRRAESKAKRDREAEAYLAERMKSGTFLVPALKLDAKRQGVSWASVRLARYVLGVQSVETPKGYAWFLPSSEGRAHA